MPNSTPPFDELPELTLSLRSFGSARRSPNERATDEEQARFFAPLLDARRTAAAALTRAEVIAAFDAGRITASLDATMQAFAAERFETPAPARRAFEAELFDIVEPLRAALRVLAEIGRTAREADGKHEQWTLWLAHLRATFRTADDTWPQLREALGASPRDKPAGILRLRLRGREPR